MTISRLLSNSYTVKDIALLNNTGHLRATTGVTCLGGAAVRRRIRDRKVAGSTPGRGAMKSTG